MNPYLMDKLEQVGFTKIHVSKTHNIFGEEDAIINFSFGSKRYALYKSSLVNLLEIDSDPTLDKLLKITIKS